MNSDNQKEPWLLRWIPWMAAFGVFGLALVLDQVGVLPGTKENLIEVGLRSDVPALRSRLRAGAVSADGLKVVLPGRGDRDDSVEVLAGFRKLLAELGADPQVITTSGRLPFAERAQEALVRRWLPWLGLAIGVWAICQLWIRLTAMSRVLVEVEPGDTLATSPQLKLMEDRINAGLAQHADTLNAVADGATKADGRLSTVEARLPEMLNRFGYLDARLDAALTGHAAAQKGLTERATKVDLRLDAVDNRLFEMGARFGTLEERVRKADGGAVSFGKRFDEADARIAEIGKRLSALRAELQETREALDGIVVPGPDPRVDELVKDLRDLGGDVDAVGRDIQGMRLQQETLSGDLGAVRDALAPVVEWRARVEPHVEAFGKEVEDQIQTRKAFRGRAEVSRELARQVPELPRLSDVNWEKGWKALAQAMGVGKFVLDVRQKQVLTNLVRKLAEGPEVGVIVEGAPGVGKSAVLRVLPEFFGDGWGAGLIPLRPNGDWYPDGMEGYAEGVGYKAGVFPAAVIEALERGAKRDGANPGCPWVLMDEINEMREPFGLVFSGFKDAPFAKENPRRIRLFKDHQSEVEVDLPSSFRLVMARNPTALAYSDHRDFEANGAWAGRVPVFRIPPMTEASERALLRRWIAWSRMAGRDRKGEFRDPWRPLAYPPVAEGDWLARLCRVMAASRLSHNPGYTDPGWRFAETGTGVTRSLIWEAASGGSDGFEARLAEQLKSKVVLLVARHVHADEERSLFREALAENSFQSLAAELE